MWVQVPQRPPRLPLAQSGGQGHDVVTCTLQRGMDQARRCQCFRPVAMDADRMEGRRQDLAGPGDDPASLEGVANFQGPQPRSQLLPVYALAPNDFGLVQMHGNVAEWCSDIHRGSREVLCAARGGSWLTPPRSGMSNARNRFAPASATRDLGVRPMYRLRMP